MKLAAHLHQVPSLRMCGEIKLDKTDISYPLYIYFMHVKQRIYKHVDTQYFITA